MESKVKYLRIVNGKLTKEYRAWKGMRSRCNPKSTYARNKHYRVNGITVCERWNSYANFIDDIGLAPSPKHSLDRIDNLKGYFPENCRWTTQDIQVRNRGKFNRNITYQGKTMCLKGWATELNLEYSGLRQRIFVRGISFKDAIDKDKIYKLVKFREKKLTLKGWAKELSISTSALYSRNSKRKKLGESIDWLFKPYIKI